MINNKQTKNSNTDQQVKRWRLILGQYADDNLNNKLDSYEQQIDQALDYLYQHEYLARGLLTEGKNRSGGKDGSVYNTVNWLRQSRKLFPKSTFERMQNQALERYNLQGILNDPNAVKELQPNFNSVRLLMRLRGKLSNSVQDEVKALIKKVVDEILQKIQTSFINTMTGKKNRFRRSLLKNSQNFDWRTTIKANLKHFDHDQQRIVIEKAIFNSRAKRQLPWDIILCVDQSGSMDSSIIYSAVCASIITQLPAVKLHLFVFDTQVVDLSHLVSDPVEILMTVQLGGGTNIGYALNYAEQRIINPTRTIMVVVSDFYEGVNLTNLYNTVARLNANRVKMLGLAALDYSATPVYDLQTSQELANRGMQIAALTPEHFANWLAEVMQ
ncbi:MULTISPECIES: VWA domain-containing protein [unclassified Gilliamella]|uniref:VWA domain-containing protein n=1 Tax=unclassified Gilliamella TaxID=2685620 RepID=UPI000A3583B0|nr:MULTISPECIES: VWA domain-containing protein [unclassified Gilliamella]OTQ74825.1 VWA containing CoxE family protein [Gilliamella sp. N-G2]OTQ80564.1 VWA containing CoxE family protein [Gilliamella sp. N-W3]